MMFEQIVSLVYGGANISKYGRERHRSKKNFYRVVVTLEMGSDVVDRFHNSASGYRAQYYCGVRTGEKANRYAVKTLLPRVIELLAAEPKRTCPVQWVRKCLQSAQAKLWIHQGRWLRSARRADRNLQVQRWLQELESQDAAERKKALWASLTPNEETKIVLKGAFVKLDCSKVAKSTKPSRSRDIRDFGFT